MFLYSLMKAGPLVNDIHSRHKIIVQLV
jgi:hypothetical protein